MRKHLPALLIALASAAPAFAQYANLDINNVSARVNAGGDLFWDLSTNPGFEVPKGSGKHTLFTGNLWIGGVDAGGQLHMAAQTYRQTGTDFFQGPISTAYSSAYDNQWNYVWKINKSTIDSFRIWTQNPSVYPGYSIPSIITGWPAHGNTSNNEAANLAPFVDANQDGNYDPANGDYPCIKGDQAVYFLFNDQRNTHTESGGLPLGIEVHGMAYSFSSATDSALNETVFFNYKIINRTNSMYSNVYLGMWTDFDIGLYNDDYIGSDVMRNAYYGYNGDPTDGSGTAGTYGTKPPAQGVVFLKGAQADPMDGIDNDRDGIVDEAGEEWGLSSFMAYNNDFTVQGNPSNSSEYYSYLGNTWLDGTPVTYGGNGYNASGVASSFMFPGTSDPLGYATGMQPQSPWSEMNAGNTPGDRRGLGASGPFTFMPGQMLCVDFAYVFAQPVSGGNTAAIPLMESRIDHIQGLFDSTLNNCGCVVAPVSMSVNEQAAEENISIYPNPATETVYINTSSIAGIRNYVITDILGREVMTGTLHGNMLNVISLSDLSKGTYVIRISGDHALTVRRITKQ
jgi:hypothetical protein